MPAASIAQPRHLHVVPDDPIAVWQAHRRQAIDAEIARLRRDLRRLRGESESPTTCTRCGTTVRPPRERCRRCALAQAWR
jgi:hypothetical protein